MTRDLSHIQEVVDARLRAKHAAREAALPQSRRAIRCAANAIRAVHRGEAAVAQSLLDECEDALRAAWMRARG